MALRDHFRPPLSDKRHWHSFHNTWASIISLELSDILPPRFIAEANVQFGIEIDMAAFEDTSEPVWAESFGYHPPAPVRSLPLTLITDIVEVAIYRNEGGPELVAAMKFVSPANKDRKAHRQAFARKCATLLQQGVNLMIIDPVTTRRANLHKELFENLGLTNAEDDPLYATAYRPFVQNGDSQFDYWYEELQLGEALPTLPLFLTEEISLPINLNETYTHLTRRFKI